MKNDRIITLGLFLTGLLTRLPFSEQILYHWDSINFALGLRHFDVAAGQPHVPGYILYVFLGQIVNRLIQNEQATLVGLSLLSSGLAPAALYLLGRQVFDRRTGLAAALFLASSPLFWFYGEIALPHTLDTFIVIVIVWLLYRLIQGENGLAVPAALLLAIGGGLRPQTQLFLMPLALLAVLFMDWRSRFAALATMTVVDLAWFIPLMTLSGGIQQYLRVMGGFTEYFNTTTSITTGGLWGLARNLRKMGMYTLYGWSLPLLAGAVGAAASLKGLRLPGGGSLKSRRFWFFFLWIVPTLAYYALIHMGQQGLVFVYLPALLLLSAAAFYRLPLAGNWQNALIAGVVAVNAGIFLFAPTYPLGGETPKLLTAQTIRQHDEWYLAHNTAVKENFDPAHTLLLTSGWRFPEYYLPAYTLARYDLGSRWEVTSGQPLVSAESWIDPAALGLAPDAQGMYTLVLFDDDLQPFHRTAARQEWLALPGGGRMAYVRFSPAEGLHLTPTSFEIGALP